MDFEEYVNTIEETLCPLGNVQTKDINYGVQIILTDTAKKVTLNIYNGKNIWLTFFAYSIIMNVGVR